MSLEDREGQREEEETGKQAGKETERNHEERGMMNDEQNIIPSTLSHDVHPKRRTRPSTLFWLFALLMTLVSMALQLPSVNGQEVIDDHGWLHDPATRGCANNAWDCFRHQQMIYYYRPLIGVSFVLSNRWFHNMSLHAAMNAGKTAGALHGHDPSFPYHVENVLQHGLVVLLVFWLFRLLFRRTLPAILAGGLFALHPLHVPVTTFIGGRPDNMALIFLALYAIGLLKVGEGRGEIQEEETGRQGDKETEAGESRKAKAERDEIQDTRYEIQGEKTKENSLSTLNSQLSTTFWLLLSLCAFTAAIFTKEQCILMVLLAPLLVTLHQPTGVYRRLFVTLYQRQGEWRRLWWLSLYLIPVLAYVVMQHHVSLMEQQQDKTRSFFSASLWSLPLHVQMVGRTCWYFAGAFLWPTVHHMHASTLGPWDWVALGPLGRNVPADLPHPPPVWVAVGGYVALGFALWLLKATWRYPACRFCLLWLFLTLLPCLNIIPVPSQFVAPYRAAIPLVGVCGLLGASFAALLRAPMPESSRSALYSVRRLSALTALMAACLWFVKVTGEDIPRWHDDLTLMYAEMNADPNFTPARGGEAYEFNRKGNYVGALESYNKMLRQLVPEAQTPEEIAQAGRTPDWPRRAASASSLRYNNIPYLANTLQQRGAVYQALGRWDEAAGDYRASQIANPADHVIGDWLAFAYKNAGRTEEEEAALKAQIAYFPDSYRLSQLGSLYYRQGRWAEARDTLQQALRAPQSRTGATADLETARRQYDEAFIRTLPSAPSTNVSP